jgi:hypothetical protein
MRRSALPVLVVACIIVATILAWLFLQRVVFRPAPADDSAGPTVAEVRTPGAFTRINVNGLAKVELVQGDRHEVLVEAPAGRVQRVQTRVEDGTLRITNRSGHVEVPLFGDGEHTASPRIVVMAPSIESIVVNGAVAFSAGRLEVPALRIAASGAAKLRIDDLTAESLRLSGAGAVQVDVAGRVAEQSISLSGAGDYRAPRLLSETAKVSVAGAGRVVVHAERSLRVSLSGAGNVEYLGNPEVRQSVSGIGRVKRRETGAAPIGTGFRVAAVSARGSRRPAGPFPA